MGDTRLDKLEQAMGLSPKPAGWLRTIWQWIAAHKATVIPIIALVLTVAGWFASKGFKYYLDHKDDSTITIADKEFDKKIGQQLKDLDKHLTEIQTILSTLEPFIEGLVRHEMDRAASLSRPELLRNLPRIKNTVEVARSQNVKVEPQTVRTLGVNLFTAAQATQGERSPFAWSVANQVLGYYSSAIPPIEFRFAEFISESKEEECIDLPKGQKMGIRGIMYSNCTVHLGSMQALEDSQHLILDHVAFKDARVIYSGGRVKLDTIYFINCTFELQPSRPSQRFADLLLAENHITHIELP